MEFDIIIGKFASLLGEREVVSKTDHYTLRQEAAITGGNVGMDFDTAADQSSLLTRPVIYDNVSGPFSKASRAEFVSVLKKPKTSC